MVHFFSSLKLPRRRHHPCGDGVRERERAAHGDDELPGADVGAGAEGHDGEALGRDAHGGQVGLDVHVLHGAREGAAVREANLESWP